jgi:NitT/TauT family transport system substrate-binding protein
MNSKPMLAKSFVGLAAVALLVVFASGPLRAADEIKLGILSTGGDHWPIWVALDRGYFKEQNLELREFHTQSIAKAIQALSANSTDLLFPTNTQGSITAMIKKAPLKIVAGNFTKALYDLIAGPKYKKVEDLKGTTFGVINLTSGSTALLQKIMSAHGFKYPGDYDLLTVGGTPQRYAAVKKGAVAGAMVTIPTSYQAKEEGLNVVANIATYLPDYQFTVIAGHAGWMESHRDQTVRFLMAIIKAMRFMTDGKNKEATIKAMLNHFKISPKYAALAYKEVIEELQPIRNDAAPSIKGIETVINLEVERKAMDKAYPATMFIDDSYRQEALKRLGG